MWRKLYNKEFYIIKREGSDSKRNMITNILIKLVTFPANIYLLTLKIFHTFFYCFYY